jgi:hypothetical protein
MGAYVYLEEQVLEEQLLEKQLLVQQLRAEQVLAQQVRGHPRPRRQGRDGRGCGEQVG